MEKKIKGRSHLKKKSGARDANKLCCSTTLIATNLKNPDLETIVELKAAGRPQLQEPVISILETNMLISIIKLIIHNTNTNVSYLILIKKCQS